MSLRPTIAAFGQVDGQLSVGGIPLTRLADRVGSTPFFAYDRALLTARVELLRSSLPKRINLSYAIKANPMPAVVQHLAGLVDSFDVASVQEMRTALDTPIHASHVSFAGPGKTEADIAQVVASGVTIEIESATEAARIVRAGNRLGLRPLARIHTTTVVGSDPLYMLTGVIPATQKVLQRAGLTLADIDLFEVNEAFAPVVLSWAEELEGAPASDLLAKTNVNGGAIAIGHPLGASGVRIMTTMVNALEQRGGRYALQTMCEAGGRANATIIERL